MYISCTFHEHLINLLTFACMYGFDYPYLNIYKAGYIIGNLDHIIFGHLEISYALLLILLLLFRKSLEEYNT